MNIDTWKVIGSTLVIVALAFTSQRCEVGRNVAWRETQARQTEACAQNCFGGFSINSDSSRMICTCHEPFHPFE